jgi:uncharacterized protein with PQ loop repeat
MAEIMWRKTIVNIKNFGILYWRCLGILTVHEKKNGGFHDKPVIFYNGHIRW